MIVSSHTFSSSDESDTSILSSSLLSPSEQIGMDDDGALTGYRIFSIEKLEQILDDIQCRRCHSDVVLSENMGSRPWLVTHVDVKCSSCHWRECLSNPISPEGKAFNTPAVLGGRLAGKGRAGWMPYTGLPEHPSSTQL